MSDKKKTAKKFEPKTEPTPELAIKDEPVFKVRGVSVGGVKHMTRSELNKLQGE